jgi:hypothetical protein
MMGMGSVSRGRLRRKVGCAARRLVRGPLEWRFRFIPSNPKDRAMGIQHAPKSQRNASKKRRKARKHKNRSTKKYKVK